MLFSLCRQIKPGAIKALGFIVYMDKFAKSYKTIDEQIAILQERGLTIEDHKSASDILRLYGYYRLVNGYQKPFWTNTDRFAANIDFKMLFDFYKFDEKFRAMILQFCLYFETNIKTIFANEFASQYGSIGCWDEENYNKTYKGFDQFFETIISLKQAAEQSDTKKNPALVHYMNRYGDIPIWVLMGALTLGNISAMFQCFKHNTQKLIVDSINALSPFNFDIRDVQSALKIMTLIRNTCAHSDPLYSFESKNSLSSNYPSYQKISDDYLKLSHQHSKLATNNSSSALLVFSSMMPHHSFFGQLKQLTENLGDLLESLSPKIKNNIIESMHYDLLNLAQLILSDQSPTNH